MVVGCLEAVVDHFERFNRYNSTQRNYLYGGGGGEETECSFTVDQACTEE